MSLAEADQRLGVLIKNLDARRIEHNSKSTAAPSEVILDLSKIESIAANVVSLNRDDSNAIDVCEDLKLQLEKILYEKKIYAFSCLHLKIPHVCRSKSASSGAQTPDPEVSDEKSDVRSFGRRVVFLLEDKLATIRTYQAEVLLKRKEKDSRSGGLFMSLFAAALNVNHSRRPSTPGSPASSLGRITGKRALEKGASTKTKVICTSYCFCSAKPTDFSAACWQRPANEHQRLSDHQADQQGRVWQGVPRTQDQDQRPVRDQGAQEERDGPQEHGQSRVCRADGAVARADALCRPNVFRISVQGLPLPGKQMLPL